MLRLTRVSRSALLFAAAISLPLQLAASNVVGVPHPERLLLLGVGLWLCGELLMYVLTRLRVSSRGAIAVSFFAVVGISRGGLVIGVFPLLGWVVLAAGVFALARLVSRIPSDPGVTAILVATTVFLLTPTLEGVYRTPRNWGENNVVASHIEPVGTPTERPDIILIVLDGYAGRVSMEDDFGIKNPVWVAELNQRGFDVPSSAWSAYPSTPASISSLLDMSHPLEPGPGLTLATTKDLYDIIGGDNELARTLSSWGYHTTMVESGWSGSACGPLVDVCVPSALLDEATFFALEQSVFADLILEKFGFAFTAGAQRSIQWLLGSAPELASNQRPDFVFAHIMAPHAPFFLDERCDVRYEPGASGVEFLRAGVNDQVREALYLEQAACLDRFMFDIADTVPTNAVLVFIADHGTDSRRQLIRQPTDWS